MNALENLTGNFFFFFISQVIVDSSSSNNIVVLVLNQKINVVEKSINEVERYL